MNNPPSRSSLFPRANRSDAARSRRRITSAARTGYVRVERAVAEFVSALPVLDMAFLLLVLTYVHTS